MTHLPVGCQAAVAAVLSGVAMAELLVGDETVVTRSEPGGIHAGCRAGIAQNATGTLPWNS